MQLSICVRIYPSMEAVDISLNKTLLGQYFEAVDISVNKALLGQYFDSCWEYMHMYPSFYSSSDFRRTCINEKILSSIELCAFCRVVRMVKMNFGVICSVYIEVTKHDKIQ
jgi:hypothetical protein